MYSQSVGWRIRVLPGVSNDLSKEELGLMKFVLIVLGVIAMGLVGVVVYALTIDAPETEIEVVIPDDKFPR